MVGTTKQVQIKDQQTNPVFDDGVQQSPKRLGST
ncbi:MAG: hypothetical protein JWO91_3703 [Acidobacteriaceae bacterium]|nr:hypothetical protein [Acidobacteriaceae bacterium]